MAEGTKKIEEIVIDIAKQEKQTEIAGDGFTNEENVAFLKKQIKELKQTQCVFGNTTQAANGDVSITGVGFQPALIKIKAWYQQDGKAAISEGIATTTTNEECYVRYFDGTNYTQDVIDNKIFYCLDNNGSLQLDAVLKSIDSDGFTLTFANYGGVGSVKYQYECYK